jgi:sterol desaturase/sphingolipid hydroxylase (fatty acid hydroxylase superfamily)
MDRKTFNDRRALGYDDDPSLVTSETWDNDPLDKVEPFFQSRLWMWLQCLVGVPLFGFAAMRLDSWLQVGATLAFLMSLAGFILIPIVALWRRGSEATKVVMAAVLVDALTRRKRKRR